MSRKPVIFLIVIVCGVGLFLGGRTWLGDDPDRLVAEALQATGDGRFAEARRLIDRLSADRDAQPLARFARGVLLLRQGRPADALRELEAGPQGGAWSIEARLAEGEALYQLGRLNEALTRFQQALALDPDNAEAHRWCAAVYYDVGALAHAIDAMETVKELAPEDFRAHYMLGVIQLDFEHYELAAKHLRSALDREPPSAVRGEIALDLARALVKGHRYEDALEVLDETPDSSDARALRANCLFALGRIDEARSLLEGVLSEAPDHRDGLLLQTQLAGLDGDWGTARRNLERILSNDPHDYECRYQLAEAFRELGQRDEFERQLALMEESRALYFRLAALNKEAMARPEDAEVRDELAALCDQLGKKDLARMWEHAADVVRNHSQPAASAREQADEGLAD